MWHYVEGVKNWNPIWTDHAIRVLPGPPRSGSMRAANGCRCRFIPASIRSARSNTSWQTGYDYSWFILTRKIIEKEFALSGSEQNPDLTGKKLAPGF